MFSHYTLLFFKFEKAVIKATGEPPEFPGTLLALKNLPHRFKLLRKYLHTDVNVKNKDNLFEKKGLYEDCQKEKDVTENKNEYEAEKKVEKEVEVEEREGEREVNIEMGNKEMRKVAADWRGSWIQILKHDILHPLSSLP